jgi:hypothetical protein
MRNTALFYNKLLEHVEVDLDKVVMAIKVREEVGEHLLDLFFMTGVSATLAPVLIDDVETVDEGRDRILNQWRHGHGRPEIIEVFNDTDGPKDGHGRELLDLSTVAAFSCSPSAMWGPTIHCRFLGNKRAESYVFFVKRDESLSQPDQCTAFEKLWRKARGEVNV